MGVQIPHEKGQFWGKEATHCKVQAPSGLNCAKSGWTYQCAIWKAKSPGPREPCMRSTLGCRCPHEKGHFNESVWPIAIKAYDFEGWVKGWALQKRHDRSHNLLLSWCIRRMTCFYARSCLWESRQGCSLFTGYNPLKPPFWGVNRHFQAKLVK